MPFIGKQPETGAFKLIDSITTSATATYALTVNSAAYFPESARNLIVSLNGVTQAPESAYTVSGSNIVFASALTASDVIDYILVIGDAVDIGTPSDNTVGTDQIASSVDLSGKTLTFANDQISGNVIDGGTISNFASTGIDDNADATAITIDSSENVGIGTASPAAQLNLSSPNNIGGASGTFTNAALKIGTTATGMFFDSNEIHGGETLNFFSRGTDNSVADYIRFSTGGSAGGERLRIDSSGNVGIGTTSPNYDLEISSAANELRLTNTGTNSTYAMLNTANNDASMKVVRQGTNASSVEVKAFGNASSITMSNFAGIETRFDSLSGGDFTISLDNGVTDKEFMYFDYSTQNIGIGTASPDTLLHLYDSNPLLTMEHAAGGSSRIYFEDATGGSWGAINANYGASGATKTITLATASGTGDGRFGGFTAGTNECAVGGIFKATDLHVYGNVGIGTTSPNALLHVSSSGNGEIEVERVGGALINLQAQSAVGVIGTDSNHDLRFKTNAGVRASITNAGNVGIGTTSPNYPLHLNKSDSAGCWAQFTNSTTGTGSGAGALVGIDSNEDFRILQYEAKALALYTSATERMRIDSAGDIYIGNNGSAATRVVEISGTNTGTNPAANGHIAGELRLRNVSATDNNHSAISWYNSNNAVDSRITGVHKSHSSRYGEIAFLTHDGSSLGERMRITSGGNVGIGTSSIDSGVKIHVEESSASLTAATTASVALFERAGNAGISIGTANTGESTIFFQDTDSATIGRVQYDHADDSLGFWANSNERMRISSAGFVGIGTTSPSYKFDIRNNGATTQTFYADCGNYNSTQTLFEHTGSNTPVPFKIAKSGYSGTSQAFGILYLHMNHATTGGGSNMHFTLLDSASNVTEYGGLGAVIQDSTAGSEDGALVFYTTRNANTRNERMRIDSSGSVLIGTTTASPGLFRVHQTTSNQVSAYFNSVSSSTSEYGIIINLQNDPNDTTRYLMVGRGATNTDRYKVFSNGNVVNQNNSYGSISDEKLKENIIDSGSQWEDIKALRVRKYSMKADALDAPNRLGVIAQEVEAAGMSGLVINSPDLDENNNELESTTKSVNYSILYMKAVKALQEAMDRIEELEARVSVLENN